MIAEIPGARIWYEDSGGAGTPLVLLHAGTGSCPAWEYQVGAFSTAGYRVIAYDRRGHGKTEATSNQDAASDDLHEILEKLKIQKLHLVGTAAGGIVALDFALSHPDRLRSLVVANSIGGVQDADYLELQRRLRPAPSFNALPPEVRELGPAYRASNPEGVRRWVAIEERSRKDGTASLPQTRNRITFAGLEKIRVPTLLLTGDADLYTPPPVLKLFESRIHGSVSVVVPECGHSAYWEQPEMFNRAVLEFIAKS